MIEVMLFFYFLAFPVIEENAYYFNTDNIEKLGKAGGITNSRTNVLSIQADGKKITSVMVSFYIEQDSESGKIIYQVFHGENEISEGVFELKNLINDSTSPYLSKIPVNIENTEGIKIVFKGSDISSNVKVGLYIDGLNTQSYVNLNDESINRYQVPVFQLNTYKKVTHINGIYYL
ncbi:MAG: hypothetical protein ACLR6B_16075 [Blautia sp.]